MGKWDVYLIMMFVMVSIVSALDICGNTPVPNSTCLMVSPSLNCSVYSYEITNKSGSLILNGNLSLFYSDIYQFNFTQPIGDYVVRLCDGTTREVFVGGRDNMSLISFIAFIPLIFGIFMLFGAATLGKDHSVLRIFLFLLSPITIWMSAHFALIGLINFYGLSELQESVGDFTYWTSILFFVLLSYFVIYAIWKWANVVAQKKEKRINY